MICPRLQAPGASPGEPAPATSARRGGRHLRTAAQETPGLLGRPGLAGPDRDLPASPEQGRGTRWVQGATRISQDGPRGIRPEGHAAENPLRPAGIPRRGHLPNRPGPAPAPPQPDPARPDPGRARPRRPALPGRDPRLRLPLQPLPPAPLGLRRPAPRRFHGLLQLQPRPRSRPAHPLEGASFGGGATRRSSSPPRRPARSPACATSSATAPRKVWSLPRPTGRAPIALPSSSPEGRFAAAGSITPSSTGRAARGSCSGRRTWSKRRRSGSRHCPVGPTSERTDTAHAWPRWSRGSSAKRLDRSPRPASRLPVGPSSSARIPVSNRTASRRVPRRSLTPSRARSDERSTRPIRSFCQPSGEPPTASVTAPSMPASRTGASRRRSHSKPQRLRCSQSELRQVCIAREVTETGAALGGAKCFESPAPDADARKSLRNRIPASLIVRQTSTANDWQASSVQDARTSPNYRTFGWQHPFAPLASVTLRPLGPAPPNSWNHSARPGASPHLCPLTGPDRPVG